MVNGYESDEPIKCFLCGESLAEWQYNDLAGCMQPCEFWLEHEALHEGHAEALGCKLKLPEVVRAVVACEDLIGAFQCRCRAGSSEYDPCICGADEILQEAMDALRPLGGAY